MHEASSDAHPRMKCGRRRGIWWINPRFSFRKSPSTSISNAVCSPTPRGAHRDILINADFSPGEARSRANSRRPRAAVNRSNYNSWILAKIPEARQRAISRSNKRAHTKILRQLAELRPGFFAFPQPRLSKGFCSSTQVSQRRRIRLTCILKLSEQLTSRQFLVQDNPAPNRGVWKYPAPRGPGQGLSPPSRGCLGFDRRFRFEIHDGPSRIKPPIPMARALAPAAAATLRRSRSRDLGNIGRHATPADTHHPTRSRPVPHRAQPP